MLGRSRHLEGAGKAELGAQPSARLKLEADKFRVPRLVFVNKLDREVREPLINDDSHYPTSIEWWAMLFESFKHIYAGGEPVYIGEDNR